MFEISQDKLNDLSFAITINTGDDGESQICNKDITDPLSTSAITTEFYMDVLVNILFLNAYSIIFLHYFLSNTYNVSVPFVAEVISSSGKFVVSV